MGAPNRPVDALFFLLLQSLLRNTSRIGLAKQSHVGTLSHPMVGPDLDTIRHALTLARKHGYDEVQLKALGVEFKAKLASVASSKKTEPKADGEAIDRSLRDVLSPCVGIFKPLAKPVIIGQAITEGDILGNVMALGLANEIESTFSGEIVELCVKADEPVQFGQVIARVKVNS